MTPEPRIAGLRRVFQLHVGRRSIEREVDAELRFHLETRRDELIARGLSEQQAARIAREEFGDLAAAKRDLVHVDRRRRAHEARSDWSAALAQDARLALRRMRATPALTLAIVVTLALGIGTNAAMFQIADRLLFEPPTGVANAEQLATVLLHIYSPFEHAAGSSTRSSFPNFSALESAPAIAGLALHDRTLFGIGTGTAAWRAPVELVSSNYFTMLGARPERGRLFSPAADSSPATPGAVISDQLWRSRFGQDSAIVGRVVRVASESYPIVGVAAPGFTGVGLQAVDVWLPVNQAASLGLVPHDWKANGSYYLSAVVRVRDGMSVKTAEAQLTTELRHFVSSDPSNPFAGQAPDTISTVQLLPLAGLRDGSSGQTRSPAASVAAWLAILSTLVLLIACANVTGLLLVRSLRRSREFALRRALGMSRGRLIAQLFIESALLASIGAIAAVVALHWTTPLLRRLVAPEVVWSGLSLRSDMLLAATTVAGVLVMALASALIPARLLTRADASAELKPMGHTATAGRSRAQAALVCAQIAICVVLLAVAGVFVQSLRRVRSLDYGINLDVIAAEVRVATGGYGPWLPPGQSVPATARLARAIAAVRQIPGVAHVDVTDASPFRSMAGGGISLPGRPQSTLPQISTGGPYEAHVSPGYFTTTGTHILRGRGFLPSDTVSGAPPVLIVSESMARLYWPQGNPIGQCAYVDSAPTCTTIVGVSRDQLRMFVTEEPRLEIFVPLEGGAATFAQMTLLINAANPAAAMPMIQRALQRVDPSAPFADIGTLRSRLDPQTQSWLLGASMMSGFAVLALILAALGLYGAVAYMVASRTHEIGVRIAVGATRTHVVGLFVRRGLHIVLAGLVLGAVGSLVVTNRLATLLFHTSPTDPAALAVGAGTLLVVAVLASVLPSSRAARVDPLEALRAD